MSDKKLEVGTGKVPTKTLKESVSSNTNYSNLNVSVHTNKPDKHIRLPLFEGYVCGHELIIKECSICGGSHTHSNDGYAIGDFTTRKRHCTASQGDIVIKIVGEVSEDTANELLISNPNPDHIRVPEFVDFPIASVGMDDDKPDIQYPICDNVEFTDCGMMVAGVGLI